jgi:uncharacterized protein YjdB
MKRIISIAMAVVILTAVTSLGVFSASAEGTATVNGVSVNIGDNVQVTCLVKADFLMEDFQGSTTYDSSGLKLNSFEIAPTQGSVIYNTDIQGELNYNGTSVNQYYDFTNEDTFYTAEFTVLASGSYTTDVVWWIVSDTSSNSVVYHNEYDKSRFTYTLKTEAKPVPTTQPITTSNVQETSSSKVQETSSSKVENTSASEEATSVKPTTPITTFPTETTVPATVKVKSINIYNGKTLLTKKSKAVYKGSKLTLTAKVNPTNANQSVSWKSSKTSVATVNSKGVVTAKAKGSARITATAKDGSNKSAYVNITVKQRVEKVTMAKTAKVKVGAKVKLKAKVLPNNANNKKLKWTVNKKKIATVTQTGVVKGIKVGKAVVTAKTTDGSNKSAKCTVTVKKK